MQIENYNLVGSIIRNMYMLGEYKLGGNQFFLGGQVRDIRVLMIFEVDLAEGKGDPRVENGRRALRREERACAKVMGVWNREENWCSGVAGVSMSFLGSGSRRGLRRQLGPG